MNTITVYSEYSNWNKRKEAKRSFKKMLIAATTSPFPSTNSVFFSSVTKLIHRVTAIFTCRHIALQPQYWDQGCPWRNQCNFWLSCMTEKKKQTTKVKVHLATGRPGCWRCTYSYSVKEIGSVASTPGWDKFHPEFVSVPSHTWSSYFTPKPIWNWWILPARLFPNFVIQIHSSA